MPHQRHGRRHSVVSYDTGSKTAEARRKPVLIDRFHLTHPQPCQTIPAFSHERASVRGRSGPDEGLPEVGRISALAGREGRLRACTENFQRED